MKTRTLQAGNSRWASSGSAGFTLMEVLAVLVIIALTAAAVATFYRSPSGSAQIKTVALLAASRLRDLRANAMTTGNERVATIHVEARAMEFSDGSQPISFPPLMTMDVTAADGESRSPSVTGVRFYPNGSSTGATINLALKGRAYEIRVNWLTGRVSTSALN